MNLHNIPTHILTGFLGVGKTSMMLALLKQKPLDEKWAILVNEFGELGVDGALLESNISDSSGVYIKEVPGGCMCCAAGAPMRVTLNALLKQAKPGRLFIEPTGLGHPKEVLSVLQSDHYRDVLAIQPVVTLVDARQLSDPRYTSHAIFNQQIEIADILVGNKVDLYAQDDKNQLISYIKSKNPKARVMFAAHGQVELRDIYGLHDNRVNIQPLLNDTFSVKTTKPIVSGFKSKTFTFPQKTVFDIAAFKDIIKEIEFERLKAVLKIPTGFVGVNAAADLFEVIPLGGQHMSRIEIIATNLDKSVLQAAIFQTIKH